MDKSKIIDFYIEQGVLLSPELLSDLNNSNPLPIKTDFIVLNKDILKIIESRKNLIVEDFEKAVVLKEKHKNSKHYDRFIEILNEKFENKKTEEIISKNSINNFDNVKLNKSGDINNKSITNNTTNTSTNTTTIVNNIINTTEERFEKTNYNLDNPEFDINTEIEKSSNEKSLENSSSNLINSNDINSNKNTENSVLEESKKSEESEEALLKKEMLKKELERKQEISLQEKQEKFLPPQKDPVEEQKKREDFLKKNKIKIVSSYNSRSKKWTVNDFVSLYVTRFKELEKILRSRQELQSLTSISKILGKKDRENVSFIGVVYEKSLTKNGNIMFTVEDQTGSIKVVVSKSKDQLFKLAEEIQLDETIGVVGTYDQIVFASNILFPDIPLTKELKKSPEEGYIVIISDTQVGGKLFLDKEFHKFISWINGDLGNEKQKEVASKVKYIFIGGDLVEGVGIYPNQEYDLSIIDVKDQYREFADLIRKIPKHIPVIVCPGNHDVGRLSEPQLPLSYEYAAPLLDLPNIVSVSNPSIINVYSQPENNFDGLDIMFYHGYSFIYYSEKIPIIRQSGGQKRPDLIMKYLLQRRHLAPSHTSTLYIPDPRKDPLVIDRIPDILISGHIHRSSVSSYKNVTCFNASCWVAKSEEQERRGLEPQPGRAFIVDMHTREVKVMNFLSKEDQDKEAGLTPINNAPHRVSA